MQRAITNNGQYGDSSVFNNIANEAQSSIQDCNASFYTPGLLNVQNSNPTFSGLTATLSLSGFHILFANGTLADALGTVNGTTDSTYQVTFVPPVSGSQTFYCLATQTDIQQNPISIPGPPLGHPDYDPTFGPYIAYTQTTSSMSISSSATPANNTTTFELFRVTLTAGQSSISTYDNTYQVLSMPTNQYIGVTLYNEAHGTGSYTVPNGVLAVDIFAGGGGGGGSNAQYNNTLPFSQNHASGAGGCAGDTAYLRITVAPGDTISWNIGQGGGAQAAGGNTFVSHNSTSILEVYGGTPGTNGGISGGYYSYGGVSVSITSGKPVLDGNVYYAGNSGSDGQVANVVYPGNGGVGPFGGGARAAQGGGYAGGAPASGGGGAYDFNGTQTLYVGGAGADGFVHITPLFAPITERH